MISEFEKNGITNHTRISAYPSIGETKKTKRKCLLPISSTSRNALFA